jgi:ergothioneine biosynthesis protein EgtB
MTDRQRLRTVASVATDGNADTHLLRYRSLREATLALAAPLSAEDCALQSMPDASPVKWHLAHTSWFFETFVLEPHLRGYRVRDPMFRMLFNSYYNAVGDKHPRPYRGLLSRPSHEEVLQYRAHVDAGMEALLGADDRGPVSDLIELGLQHEQQHQELVLTDVLHLLSCNPLKPAYAAAVEPTPATDEGGASALRWVDFPGGLNGIGHAGSGFAFDNESPSHRVYLEPYSLANRLITNAEYLAFMADGGYCRPELWLSEGWDWVNANAIEAPHYWQRDSAAWRQFTLHGSIALDMAAPVCHISFFEADAYARWAGARLPREAEWECAASSLPVSGHFVEDGILRALPYDDRGETLGQIFGDVWEWTQSPYTPYPRYRAANGAIGEYNGKFMCNQFVLRGGSCATPRSHIRPSYRNFFPAPARWQFTGVRLARDH